MNGPIGCAVKKNGIEHGDVPSMRMKESTNRRWRGRKLAPLHICPSNMRKAQSFPTARNIRSYNYPLKDCSRLLLHLQARMLWRDIRLVRSFLCICARKSAHKYTVSTHRNTTSKNGTYWPLFNSGEMNAKRGRVPSFYLLFAGEQAPISICSAAFLCVAFLMVFLHFFLNTLSLFILTRCVRACSRFALCFSINFSFARFPAFHVRAFWHSGWPR